jgi:hypothetical protein
MKTKRFALIALSMVIVIAMTMVSCKKDNILKLPKYRSAQDNAIAEKLYGDVFNKADDAARNHISKSGKDVSTCPTYTVSGYTFPITVTMDFGSGCVGSDGLTRKGKIVSVISLPYTDSSSTIISHCENFHVLYGLTDYTVAGRQVITNIGHNNSGNYIFTVVVDSSTISFTESGTVKTITWRCNRQNEWIEGEDTWFNIFDDVYLVTGTSSGNDINGDPFEINITSPLRVPISCGYVTAGTLDIINPGYPTISVDFGNGTCDYSFTVTVNGMTFPYVI